MPIVFIHGVAVRDKDAWKQMEAFLRRYIADEVNPSDPENVEMIPVYWGDIPQFAWDRMSRPLSQLLGQGGQTSMTELERAKLMAAVSDALKGLSITPSATRPSRLIAAGPSTVSDPAQPLLRLKNLTPDELSDLAVTVIQNMPADAFKQSLAAIAADEVAHDPVTYRQLAACPDTTAELALLQQLISERYDQLEKRETGLIGQGPGWLQDMQDHLGEALSRADQSPGFAVSQVLGEIRPPLNNFITLFLGDVFTYLVNRKDASAPGEIPQRLLDGLAKARAIQKQRPDEPLVVLSHSMGGQIVYDVVTSFLPKMDLYKDIRVDFWCATASQVGLFEELKLFLAPSDQYSLARRNKVPFPDRRYLGVWWNVWDSNDFLSYTVKPIFEGVDDEPYSSGMSVLGAHGGYLQRPSFYRVFAAKLRSARANNWSRS